MITEVADKRLRAIKEFTELGSGFKIAMRDLEIRGAGSLLRRNATSDIWTKQDMILIASFQMKL